MASLAERFHARFNGLERGHGHAVPKNETSQSGKRAASHQTVHEPATVVHWERHLKGDYSLGIIPIRDDATCVFGAIDVDDYSLKLEDIAKEVESNGIPLIVCRTKSGGAHLYAFTKEAVTAELMRSKLSEWAVMLGYSGVEVFPKQVRLAGVNDYGNWINMPYFEGNKTTRYAIANGKPLKTEAFLDLADMMAIEPDKLATFQLEAMTEFQEWLEEGPPCLQTLAKRGFSEGARNNGLFNIGVYLRNRYPDDWQHRVDQYNQKFMSPPLGHKEVTAIVRALDRKKYGFKCNDQPIVDVCNRQICLGRRFGIGQATGDPGVVFGDLVKILTVPPIWIWDVNGRRIELATTEMKDQGRFHTRCIDELNIWPKPVKPDIWSNIVREKLEGVVVQEAPPDASQDGQVWAYLADYCTRSPGKRREDLLQNRPWTDPESGLTHFRADHFRQFLEQQRVRVTERTLWSILRKRKVDHDFVNVKGRGINTWVVPAFPKQTEDFVVPSTEVVL